MSSIASFLEARTKWNPTTCARGTWHSVHLYSTTSVQRDSEELGTDPMGPATQRDPAGPKRVSGRYEWILAPTSVPPSTKRGSYHWSPIGLGLPFDPNPPTQRRSGPHILLQLLQTPGALRQDGQWTTSFLGLEHTNPIPGTQRAMGWWT